MLVLSRCESEQLVLGENIELTVVAISGNQVRIGIKAPSTIAIRRSELEPLEIGRPDNRRAAA